MSLSHYPVTLRTGSRHRSLSRAVAVALALSAGSGLAQDVGEVEVSPKKGGYSLALEEVVVTAQKRGELLHCPGHGQHWRPQRAGHRRFHARR
jgi:hypothetical protein